MKKHSTMALLLAFAMIFAFWGTAFAAEEPSMEVVIEDEVIAEEQPAAASQNDSGQPEVKQMVDRVDLIENSFAGATPISVGQKIQLGGKPVPDVSYFNVDMKYKFTLDKPSEVVFNLSTEDKDSGYRENMLTCDIYYENEATRAYLTDKLDGKYYGIGVEGGKEPLEKALSYKLLAGTYYVRVKNLTALNAYGWIEFVSSTPAGEDSLNEPNDSLPEAKPIKFGATYSGNICYYGVPGANSRSKTVDGYDYYKVSAPFDGCVLKLTASRADAHRENNLIVLLVDRYGYGLGGQINLMDMTDVQSKSYTYKNLRKGTYYVLVNGASGAMSPTEYTFKLEDVTVRATGVSLSKTSATLAKGSKLTLKATVNPSNATIKAVTWTSGDPAVASVSSSGVVTARSRGVVNITAKTKDGGKYAKCRVVVKAS